MTSRNPILFLSLALIATLRGVGQERLVGDTLLPSSAYDLEQIMLQETGTYALSVEDFLGAATMSNFRLLKDGNRVSYFLHDSIFVVREINSDIEKEFSVLNFDPDIAYTWIDDHRVLFVADNDGKEAYHLYLLDIETTLVADLTPYTGVSVRLLNELTDQPNQVVVAMNKDNLELFEPYLLNVDNGALVKLFENNLKNEFVTDYFFTSSGDLSAYYTQNENQDYVLYYKSSNGTYGEVLRLAFGDLFVILKFDAQNPNLVYATSNLESDKRNIVLYDLEKRKVVKTLFTNETYDIDEIGSILKHGEIDFYTYTGTRKTIVPVSEAYTAIHLKLSEHLEGQIFEVKGASAERDKFLIYSESDRIAGKYYLYYPEKDSLRLLADTKPKLQAQLMTKKSAFSLYARDSLRLEGYYYKPLRATENDKAPLLVIPHGGPFDIRNEWRFVNYAQLLANRGYCVLEVNFRGSFGYGKQFQSAGYNQIGRAMLHDIEDAIGYMSQYKWVDAERVGIYGPSYGGLAVLQSLVEYPDLFKCGIDYCGPSNLFTLFDAFPPSWKEYIAFFHRAWYNPNLEHQQSIMQDVSPYFHLDSITKPVFVIHGANDPRVPISESDQVVRQLRKNGLDVPYLVRYDEGHGFLKEKNNIDLHRVILGFLAENLKK